jgi:4-methylaminobutanoate oxidase (formaldehyde-forming)
VFKTKERLKLSQRQMARAKSFGIEFEFISPDEAGTIAPILRTDDLSGAVWIPVTARPIPRTSRNRWPRGRACVALRSSRA